MTSDLPQHPLVIGCNKGTSPTSPTIEQAHLKIDSNDVRGLRGQRSTFVRWEETGVPLTPTFTYG